MRNQRKYQWARWGLPALLAATMGAASIFYGVGTARESSRGPAAGTREPADTAATNQASELGQEARITLEMIREFWKWEQVDPEIYPEFPVFRIPPRKGELEYYPCLDCHDDQAINITRERVLVEEHESIVLDHGGNRFWCLTCHNLANMDYLRSLKNQRIDFNQPYLLCGQCHSPRQADWFFGGHGKRIGTWAGEKVLLGCTECHNPHSPSIKPRRPDPPPKIHPGPQPFLSLIRLEWRRWTKALGWGPKNAN